MRALLFALYTALSLSAFAGEPQPAPLTPGTGPSTAVQKKLTKLPGVLATDVAESTPLVYRGRQLLFCSRRSFDPKFNVPEHHYLYVRDLQDGRELTRFGQGHTLGSAFVEGETLHVFAAESTKDDLFHDIYHFSSSDLKSWKREVAVVRIGSEHLFNSSVCRDEQGYLMAHDSDVPFSFCFKFARSKDLYKWERIPGLAFAGVGGKEYSGCPVIRYVKPYYYAIYLHGAIPGHNGWVAYLARSKDLETWQLSPKNPILEAGPGEGGNNSDVDLIEVDGKTYVYYLTGDQQTWGDLKRAFYPGPMLEFFEGYFPQGSKPVEISARIK